jgi:succinate dehydrogenase / fumarate reductase, iron-sulfur subunit
MRETGDDERGGAAMATREMVAGAESKGSAGDAYTAAQTAQDALAGHAARTFRVWRGDRTSGRLVDYTTEITEGMVVLDAIHQIQSEQANDLAVRWNCKAGKCGSCSAEINGSPRLMCMTRMSELPGEEPVTVEPMRAFPPVRDLVTDVSWNFRVKPRIAEFTPRPPDAPDGTWRIAQADVDRVQEFRKCIECFLCQDVCHVLRDHQMHEEFVGPRYLVYAAALEMHPLDVADRVPALRGEHGIGYCNITKCCTAVCPEHITITDNAIIPLKERVVDEFFDPLGKLVKLFSRRGGGTTGGGERTGAPAPRPAATD